MKRTATTFDLKGFLAAIGNGRMVAKYRKNAKIFAQGDEAKTVNYVQSGKVKISVVSRQGRSAVIAIVDKGEFFGEGCLAGQARRMASATAMEDCEILRLPRETVMARLKDQPSFAELFVSHLLTRTVRVEADLVDQLFNSSEKRLARALLLLANFGKEGRPEPIVAKVSQEMLASMIGTTRPRVSYFMNKFRRLGFISYNGKFEIHSSLLSVVLADNPRVLMPKAKRARNGNPKRPR